MLNGDVWPYLFRGITMPPQSFNLPPVLGCICDTSIPWSRYANLFHNMTGSNDYDNFLNTDAPASFNYYSKYVNLPATRSMLHVGSAKFPFNPTECEMNLLADFVC